VTQFAVERSRVAVDEAIEQAPETDPVTAIPKMGDLMEEHIITQVFRESRRLPVDVDPTIRRAGTPHRPLSSYHHAVRREAAPGGELRKTRDEQPFRFGERKKRWFVGKCWRRSISTTLPLAKYPRAALQHEGRRLFEQRFVRRRDDDLSFLVKTQDDAARAPVHPQGHRTDVMNDDYAFDFFLERQII